MGNLKEISNEKEYKIIRDEIQNLKNCITNYMGFVLGGSGISYAGLISIGNNINKEEAVSIAFLSIILAFVVSLVFLILIYKFNSHNRYAGYCKLLNQEQLLLKNNENINPGDIDIMSWEICVDRLRSSKFNSWILEKMLDELVKEGVLSQDQRDRKNKKSESWQFPFPVSVVFFILSAIFIIYSIYLIDQKYAFENITRLLLAPPQ